MILERRFCKRLKPVQNNFAVGEGFKTEVKGMGTAAFQAGTDGTTTSFAGELESFSSYVHMAPDGATTSGTSILGEQVTGPPEKSYEEEIEIEVPNETPVTP